jgi:hypothetical protein
LKLLKLSLCCLLLLVSYVPLTAVVAQTDPGVAGHWRINTGLSDDTDDEVEKALKTSGSKVETKWFDRRKDKYRGGPADQELYDRFSYDPVLTITPQGDNYVFEYADNFKSVVYTDNSSHTVSLNALETAEDFLEGQWKDGKLLVEMHPRDGGYVYATYALVDASKSNGRNKNSKRLQVSFIIKPGSFLDEFKLKRVYDRQP